ncbi:hypothetical protein GCM10009809_27740 [Isoptericola hypogeus]|uniref:alpha-amylase n=1 Tax=Isoptericola hypogeus TaxID=300179 RepID=A0ABN2JKL3_9MICO
MGVALVGAVGTASADEPVPVERAVERALSGGEETTFWVYLDEQADLTSSARVADRAEQGQAVYDELTSTARRSQAGLVDLLSDEGAEYEQFWVANAVKVTGDADLLDRISSLPDVAEVTADRTYEVPEVPDPDAAAAATAEDIAWGVQQIGAADVWDTYGATGEGIVVGSIDTGVQYDHPALVEQYRGTQDDGTFVHDYNWWDPSGSCGDDDPCDTLGHGTHTVGTMLGSAEGHRIGVAPDAEWIAATACPANYCSQSLLLSAGQWMLAPTDRNGEHPDPSLRPHVINNSWGSADAGADPWYDATVDAWLAAGIFPVFAGGNNGPQCGTAGNPGSSAAAYSVGAYDSAGAIATFSGRGPSPFGDADVKPDIAAPGVAIQSAVPGDRYVAMNGTSMAAPHVAGAVALLWSAAPALERDLDGTRAVLDGSAVDVEDLTCGGTVERNNVWGEGRLDVLAAVAAAPRSPQWVLDGTVTDAETGDPVPGAALTFTGPVERTATADGEGRYAVRLPEGDYTVGAGAFGYVDAEERVTVVADEGATRSVALRAPAGVAVHVSPSLVDFGVVAFGTVSDVRTVTVTGLGADAATIDEVGGLSEGFRATGGTCDAGTTLDRWDSCTIELTYRPQATGRVDATLGIGVAGAGTDEVAVSGTGRLLPAAVDSLDLARGESAVQAAVMDPDGRYAYYGTHSLPGRVVKVDLRTMQRVGAIELDAADSVHRSAVVDPEGRFAYFGTRGSPGRVVKIDLESFELAGSITLAPGENDLRSALIDPDGRFAYFGTGTSPGRVVKVDLRSFERVGATPMASGENSLAEAAISPDGSTAYFATYTLPTRVVKVDLGSMERVEGLTMERTDWFVSSAVMTPDGGNLLVGVHGTPGKVLKVGLEPFARLGAITLGPNENTPESAVVDPQGEFAYFGTASGPGSVVQVDVGSFERVQGIVTPASVLTTSLMSPDGGSVYTTSYGSATQVVRVQLDAPYDVAATVHRVRDERSVRLAWEGSLTTETEIYRDGERVATVPNDGEHTDDVADDSDSVTYRLCDAGGDRCSDDVAVSFDDGPGEARISDDNGWDTGLQDGDYHVLVDLWWGQAGTSMRLYENGALIRTEQLTGSGRGAQHVSVPVTGRADGEYTYTCELVNAAGTTACANVHTVRVTEAGPGVPVLSHDNHDGDGAYTVTMDKWWGTQATGYVLLEDGVEIDRQDLTRGSGGAAQSATTVVTGREPGTHRYVGVLSNATGETRSRELSVVVRP